MTVNVLAPRPVPVEKYRLKALTDANLEDLCRTAYKETRIEAGKYEGSRLTEEVAIEMTSDVVMALEALRLALTALLEHRREPTDHVRWMDLSGVVGYFKRTVGEHR